MTKKCSNEKWKEEEQKIVNDLSRYQVSESCETWLKIKCPDCGSINWASMSVRYEACRCHKCKKIFWMSEKIYDDYKTELTMSIVFDFDANWLEDIFDGLEFPN
jgi:ribosomal protein S27E